MTVPPGPWMLMPDSMAANSFFADQVRKRFSQGADPGLDDLIKNLSRESLEGHWKSLADLDAAAQGGGRHFP